MNGMKISAMLEEEIKRSETYAEDNFGAPMGSDWAEITREILANEPACVSIFARFMAAMLSKTEIAEKMKIVKEGSIPELLVKMPKIYINAAEFFYWGIQIGRRLEREQAAMLKNLK